MIEQTDLTRRQFLGFTAGLAIVSAADIALGGVFKWPYNPSEKQEYQTLEQIVRDIDSKYSSQTLDLETARENVVPAWIKAYLKAAHSTASVNEILSLIKLTYSPKLLSDNHVGNVKLDLYGKQITDFTFNLGVFRSDSTISNANGESAPGIVFERSGIFHELTHFDTSFIDQPDLGRILLSNQVTNPPVESTNLMSNGFTLLDKRDGKQGFVYFPNFDESITDVISTHISNKLGLSGVMLYPDASALRDFLDWIGFDRDQLINLHRQSDLPGFGMELVRISNRRNAMPDKISDEQIYHGLVIVDALSRKDTTTIAKYFPGSENIFNRQPQMLRNSG